MIDQTTLQSLLNYDPYTGVFTWLKNGVGRAKGGAVAGSVNDMGYVRISIGGVSYRAHRLAWLYTYGVFPSQEIDHRNHNRSDNRIDNLRLASHHENTCNKATAKNQTSGLKGVYRVTKPNRYGAQIKYRDKKVHLGVFSTVQDAHDAYCRAASKYFGKFFTPDCSCHQTGSFTAQTEVQSI